MNKCCIRTAKKIFDELEKTRYNGGFISIRMDIFRLMRNKYIDKVINDD